MGRRYDRGRSGNKLLTNLLRDLFHLRNIQGRDPNKQEKGEMRLMVSIRRDTLDAFWIRELGTFRCNLTMVKTLSNVAREELGLEEWLPPLGPYILQMRWE